MIGPSQCAALLPLARWFVRILHIAKETSNDLIHPVDGNPVGLRRVTPQPLHRVLLAQSPGPEEDLLVQVLRARAHPLRDLAEREPVLGSSMST